MPEATIIDGRAVAARIAGDVAAEVTRLKAETLATPGLAVVLVGDNPASRLYVGGKSRKAEELGFHSVQHNLPADTSEADLLALVEVLNRDPRIHGILVQMPLPPQIDKDKVIEAILPEKDVDGFHPVNVGKLAAGLPGALVPCTPAGSLILIREVLGGDLSGKSAVVIGRSNIVGKPMAQLLLQASCTVTVAHSRTHDLAAVTREAEIVVAAAGRAEMVRGDWLRPGATVIDVGQNTIPAPEKGEGKTRLVGDVAYREARAVAGAITPVPGGVGPMTIAMLMANTLVAACRITGQPPPDFGQS
ncbi:MAG: bifunctional methylenetetrahydrofolate dehydrogenase/methenyltetrahydrofolate cyclohydrolase FolD [Rhizobiales bacterium]|nr:bifunctional methylenetetrahydrofolate dehydrogenase/methenyltetrahydrofolate cyclohydrolase FolD [Hyphomicrobiales bacterium]